MNKLLWLCILQIPLALLMAYLISGINTDPVEVMFFFILLGAFDYTCFELGREVEK